MDRYPLILKGKTQGEIIAETESLYTCFSVHARPPTEGIWCAWAVGEKGELRIGVLEPVGGELVIRRKFSARLTNPLGKLLRGELRPVGKETEKWIPILQTERPFRKISLCRHLQGIKGALICKNDGCRKIAFPFSENTPFPLTALFCFAQICRINGQEYAVYMFDPDENPIFSYKT